jgi:hypothetical protein
MNKNFRLLFFCKAIKYNIIEVMIKSINYLRTYRDVPRDFCFLGWRHCKAAREWFLQMALALAPFGDKKAESPLSSFPSGLTLPSAAVDHGNSKHHGTDRTYERLWRCIIAKWDCREASEKWEEVSHCIQARAVPSSIRPTLWMLCLGAHCLRDRRKPGYFKSLLYGNEEVLSRHEYQVPHPFDRNDFFSPHREGRTLLRELLEAFYSNYHDDLDREGGRYIPYIGANVLMRFHQYIGTSSAHAVEQCFWTLSSIYESCSIWRVGGNGNTIVTTAKELMIKQLPSLASIFIEYEDLFTSIIEVSLYQCGCVWKSLFAPSLMINMNHFYHLALVQDFIYFI